MTDRITARVEAIALPWFGRSMRIGTGLLAVALFSVQVLRLPAVDPVTGIGPVVGAAVGAVAGAAAIATGLKVVVLAVRVPVSLFLDSGRADRSHLVHGPQRHPMRLLVAVDGSGPSEAALEHALSLAEATGGSVTAVHAVDPSVYATVGTDPGGGPEDRADRFVVESVDDAEERGRRLLGEAAAAGDEVGVSVETELLRGDPREVIPAMAARDGFDELVVGHRGLPDHQERVLGSVAKSFVERSSVPVTVVP